MMREEVNGMSELKNGFLTAEEVMDILQIKQSKNTFLSPIRHKKDKHETCISENHGE